MKYRAVCGGWGLRDSRRNGRGHAPGDGSYGVLGGGVYGSGELRTGRPIGGGEKGVMKKTDMRSYHGNKTISPDDAEAPDRGNVGPDSCARL